MRVLLTGASGQLATDILLTLADAGDDVTAPDRANLDITDRDAVRSAVHAFRPSVIINCAAWTAVDACEGDPDRALAVNGTAVGVLAEVADSVGAHLVHVSTDYVFSGTLDRPYTEQDVPDPLSAYGRSKLAGERAALANLPTATIVRTSWLCGEHGPNMVKTILRLAGGDAPLRFVDDQRGSPTFTADLAPLLRVLAVTRVPGIVHATNQGAVSWYEFARSVLAADGHDPDRVTAVSTSDLQPPRPAPRPANSVLANIALQTVGIPLLRPFGEPLHELVARLPRSKR